MKKQYKKVNKYEQVTSKILSMLESGVKPWVKPWSSMKPKNIISSKEYKGINPLLCQLDMVSNGWEHPLFLSFNQAKSIGWKVKKGSKATSIMYASRFDKEVDKDGKKEKVSFFTSKWLSVFNIACIDDSESDKKVSEYIGTKNNVGTIADAEKFISKQKANISFGGDRAFYSPSKDSIQMPSRYSFTSEATYYSTLFHELSHRTGHESRLNRDMGNGFGSDKYAYEELVAELTASFVISELSLPFENELSNHASYIASWIKQLREDDKVFFRASKDALKASQYMLEQ